MKHYWDYTEKERSEMTEQDVDRFVDYELMQQGVLKPVAPKYDPVEPVTVGPTTTWYKLAGLVFESFEQAQACVQLNPRKLAYDWQLSREYHYATDIPAHETKPEPVELYNHDDLVAAKARLKANDEAEKRNKSLREEYERATRVHDDALHGLWEDWHRCRALADKHQRVQNVRSEYVKTAGDPAVAEKFLRKVFAESDIYASDEWFGLVAVEEAQPA